MGFFVIRRTLVVRGGSVQIGADCNLYRDTTNRLKTDDALSVSGTVNFGTAVRFAGSVTMAGSPFVGEYGTVDTTTGVNGQIAIRHVDHVPHIVIRSGGTSYDVAFPTSDHGTATYLVV